MPSLFPKRVSRAGFHAVFGALAVFFIGCELIATVERDLIRTGNGGSTPGVGGHAGGGGDGGDGGHGGVAPECTLANASTTCGSDAACASHDCVAGTCVVTNKAVGAPCSDGGVVCNAAGNCVDAHCMDAVVDADESDVDCGGSCPACANDKTCAKDGDCASGNCASGDPNTSTCKPCAASNDCPSNRYCDATTKACVNDKAQGVVCADGAECVTASCADGVCCDTACDAGCSACSKAKDADVDGTCKAKVVTSGQDAGACDDTKGNCGAKCSCDALGGCKRALGATCTLNTDCSSTFCADGVCCNTACAAGCSACSKAKDADVDVDGTCKANVVTSGQDMGACDDTQGGCGAKCTCDALGGCKRALGAACAAGPECSSGFCTTNVCAAS